MSSPEKVDAAVLRILLGSYGVLARGKPDSFRAALRRLEARGLAEERVTWSGRHWHATEKQREEVRAAPGACSKCSGTGRVPFNRDGGRCWDCGGRGTK